MSTYAYRNLIGHRVFTGSNNLSLMGTWDSSGTYSAAQRHVADYLNSRYIALIDSINVVPLNSVAWSPLVLVATAPPDSTEIAQSGDNYEVVDGVLKIKNKDTGRSHRVDIVGASGTEQWEIQEGD